jgi:hypothetical protein
VFDSTAGTAEQARQLIAARLADLAAVDLVDEPERISPRRSGLYVPKGVAERTNEGRDPMIRYVGVKSSIGSETR